MIEADQNLSYLEAVQNKDYTGTHLKNKKQNSFSGKVELKLTHWAMQLFVLYATTILTISFPLFEQIPKTC